MSYAAVDTIGRFRVSATKLKEPKSTIMNNRYNNNSLDQILIQFFWEFQFSEERHCFGVNTLRSVPFLKSLQSTKFHNLNHSLFGI